MDNPAKRRFEINYSGHRAELVYERRGNQIIYLHTGVPQELEGHGIAGRLAQYALDYAREQHLRVVPLCPYVLHYLDQHPEYQDLVDAKE